MPSRSPASFELRLDVQASEINEAMKLAAAQAIAQVIPEEALERGLHYSQRL